MPKYAMHIALIAMLIKVANARDKQVKGEIRWFRLIRVKSIYASKFDGMREHPKKLDTHKEELGVRELTMNRKIREMKRIK